MAEEKSQRLTSFPWLVGWLALILVVIATSLRGPIEGRLRSTREVPIAGAGDPAELAGASEPAAKVHFATTIRRPSGPPVIELGPADPQGRSGTVACPTCHSVRPANLANRMPADLDEFHQNMPLAHGRQACYACHNPDDADTLRLADGTPVEYADVMTLCAQCHGTQAEDYAHGAHGGMNGYWDLSRGPRTRNNCVDCHDPHVPTFPKMQPDFKPRDRFLEPHGKHSDSEVHGE